MVTSIVAQAFYKVDQVAAIVALSPRSVRRDIDTGALRAVKRGQGKSCRVLIPADALAAYVATIVAESTPLGPQ